MRHRGTVVNTLAAFLILALTSSFAYSQEEQLEWLEYDAADIQVINDGIAFGLAPDFVLTKDTLEKAQIIYGDPTLILYDNGSRLLLKRFTKDNLAPEFGDEIAQAVESDEDLSLASIPPMMFSQGTEQTEGLNQELVKQLQAVAKRLLDPLKNQSKQFHAQQNTASIWFVLSDQENIALLTDSRLPDQFVLVRSQNMPRGDFQAQVVNGALQPEGSEWESEDRDIPIQHTIPLPK